jgi:hypothetical protein
MSNRQLDNVLRHLRRTADTKPMKGTQLLSATFPPRDTVPVEGERIAAGA